MSTIIIIIKKISLIIKFWLRKCSNPPYRPFTIRNWKWENIRRENYKEIAKIIFIHIDFWCFNRNIMELLNYFYISWPNKFYNYYMEAKSYIYGN